MAGIKKNSLVLGGVMLFCAVFPARALENSKTQDEFFENKIRPILVDACYKCHSSQSSKLKGGLSVEFRDALLKGGETGPAIVSGDPEHSLLIKAVRYLDPDMQMPPKDQKLSNEQIANLVAWVKMGAPYPKPAPVASRVYVQSDRDHWSFKPVKKPAIPEVKDTNWGISPIDNFIVAKLEASGMKPAPMTDKRTLIRRATFDLLGLAPTLKETQDFLDDTSTNAFEKVVDRLLASPQYGERWGRFWLDTARYSDTKGEVKVQREDFRYAFAWTYRDYVIKSFNDDKPYNRFIIEQIAADKLQLGTNIGTLAAMGFLTLGERFDEKADDIINDRIDVVTKGTLGLTVACARCHDHKFDPIPTKDYYSLRGIFASSVEPTEEPFIVKLQMTPEYLEFAKKFNALNDEVATLAAVRGKDKTQQIKQKEAQLQREIGALESSDPGSPPRAMVLLDRPKPINSPVFIRGEAENRGEIVPRRFLEILSGPNRPVWNNGSGRLELAQAIASTNNPLTARVMVNRIWMHHFGEGIVTTPDDFGNQSAPPSHPELLDYLASSFMESGWSMKKMHRLIMLSSVYQESSENNPHYAQQDPENRLLWRANIRRLEFEAVRDSLLAIGGRLDKTMGGHPINLGGGGGMAYSTRRTIYGFVDRRNLPEVYTQFDFANPDITTGQRYQTIVPQQALFMMNSPLVVEQARNLIHRSDFEKTPGAAERIKLLYDIIYQREPTPVEVNLGINFLKDSPVAEIPDSNPVSQEFSRNREKGKGKRTPPAMSLATIPATGLEPLGAWARYAHALLQANEAMFIN